MFKIIRCFFLVSVLCASATEKCEKSKDESIFKGYQNSVVIPLVGSLIFAKFGYCVGGQTIATNLSLVGYYGTRLYLCNTIIPVNWTQVFLTPVPFDFLIYYNREELRRQKRDFKERWACQMALSQKTF